MTTRDEKGRILPGQAGIWTIAVGSWKDGMTLHKVTAKTRREAVRIARAQHLEALDATQKGGQA